MIIFANIVNDKILNNDDIKPWLLKNCQKWIILNEESNIYIIFSSNKSSRLDSIVRSLKSFIFSSNENAKDNLKITTKKIILDEKFSQILQTYFSKINNTEIKGYTKKYLLSILEKKNDDDNNVNEKICAFCDKELLNKINRDKHQSKCHKRNNNDNDLNSKNNNTDELKEELKDFKNEISSQLNNMFKEFKNVQQVQQIQQVNNTTNNVNIQINNNNNNYKTKKDKLNHYLNLKNMIDIDTFINNYQYNEKYHLTKDESQILLENSQNMGVSSYGDGLFTYLKKKYALQLQDLTGDDKKYHEVILPFVCSDINLRNHYELTPNGWLLNKNNDKLKNIVTISDQQIFNHMNRFICYSAKKGKNNVINIFLRKSDYSQIEHQLTLTDTPSTLAIQ